jgi:integrase/recombinase XerC
LKVASFDFFLGAQIQGLKDSTVRSTSFSNDRYSASEAENCILTRRAARIRYKKLSAITKGYGMKRKSIRGKTLLQGGTARVQDPIMEGTQTSLEPKGIAHLDRATFAPDADCWLTELKVSGQSQSTIDCYARDLRDGHEAISGVIGKPAVPADLAEVGQTEVNEIVSYWQAAGAAVPTVLRRFASLRGFSRFLWRRGGLSCMGLISARLPQTAPGERPAIDEYAFDVMASHSPADESWIGHRDRATFLLQAVTGVTTAELVALDCCHLLNAAAGIVVINSTRATRILTTDAEASEALRKYEAVVPFDTAPSRPLFVNRNGERLSTRSVQISFSRRRTDLGLPPTTNLMSVRHRLGERLAASSNSPSYVADRLGISVKSVGRYFAARRHRNALPSNRKQRSQTGRGTGRAGGKHHRDGIRHPVAKPTSNLPPSLKAERSKMDP